MEVDTVTQQSSVRWREPEPTAILWNRKGAPTAGHETELKFIFMHLTPWSSYSTSPLPEGPTTAPLLQIPLAMHFLTPAGHARLQEKSRFHTVACVLYPIRGAVKRILALLKSEWNSG